MEPISRDEIDSASAMVAAYVEEVGLFDVKGSRDIRDIPEKDLKSSEVDDPEAFRRYVQDRAVSPAEKRLAKARALMLRLKAASFAERPEKRLTFNDADDLTDVAADVQRLEQETSTRISMDAAFLNGLAVRIRLSLKELRSASEAGEG